MIRKVLNKLGLYTKKQILEVINESLEEHKGEKPCPYNVRLFDWGGYSAVEGVKNNLFRFGKE